MEPRSRERGNPGTDDETKPFIGLQWSRAQESAEMQRGTPLNRRQRLASMEPRSRERGNHGQRFNVGLEELASMEPRSRERGNWLRMRCSNSD